MATVGYATLQIIPAIKGITGNVTQQLGGDLVKAGQKAGRDTGDAIAAGIESAKGKVAKASATLAKARDAEATASEKVGVAEAKLQALRDKGVTDAGRLAAAEAGVSKAKRDHAASSRNLESASSAQSKAQGKLTEAEKTAAEQADKLAESADKAGDSVEGMGGKSLISSEHIAKIGIAAGTAAIAAGGALYKIGETFDDVADTIRVGTGATGEQLEAMVDVAKRVGTEVPSSFEDIGSTVADLNTRLGLSGPALEQVSKQFLELGNQGIDADINAVSQAMTGFGIKGAEVEGALDSLFQVSQATGLSVTELANSAVKAGPGLRAFGFGIQESAALAGSLDKAGLDADKTLAGLSRALTVFASEGKKPKEALFGTIQEIEKFTKAGDQAAAINLAAKLFGTRGAAQFVDAVKSGTMSAEDLMKATGATSDTIIDAAADTHDFAESWQLFKNKALVAIEPVASKVFGIIGDGMAVIADKGVPALTSMAKFVGDNKVAFGILGGVLTAAVLPALTLFAIEQAKAAASSIASTIGKIASAWGTVGKALKSSAIAQWAMNSAVLANPLTWIIVALVAVGVALWAFFTKTETGRKLWDSIWNGIKAAVSAVVNWFKDTAWPLLQGAFQKIGEIAMWLYNNAILPAWNGIKTAIGIAWAIIKGYFTVWMTIFKAAGAVVMWLWNNVMVPAWNAIKAAISVAWSIIKPVVDGIKAGFKLIGDAANWLWNEVIKPVWDWIGRKIDETKLVIGIAIDLIKQHFQSVADKATEIKDWIVDKFNAVVDFFTGIGGKIADAAKGMWEGFKEAAKSAFNWVANIWNSTVGSLEFTIPSWVPKMGGKSFAIKKIPTFAQGGLLQGPGTGTSDSILGVDGLGRATAMVSNGEFVVNAKATAANLPLLKSINSGAIQALAAGGTVGREPYGLPVGTNTGGYGSGSDLFPPWVHEIEKAFNVKASTYPGHQEGSGQNKGIDWVGSIPDMQRLAEHFRSIKDQLEQVIWMNPDTGEKIGVVDGEMVGPGTDQPGYYRDDWAGHANHVHSRQSYSVSASADAPEPVEVPVDPADPDATATTEAAPDTTSTTSTATEAPKRMKSFRELGSDVGGLVADGIVDFFGIPSWIANPQSAIKSDDGSSVRTDGATSETQQTPTSPASPDQVAPAASKDPDAKDYSAWITKAAKDLNLPERAAVIGNATALVESGDPMRMYANNAIPESLTYPHDAVGSDHDSIGLFQQRPGWGTVAQRMSPVESAKLFYEAMSKVAGWETMPEGDVAQAVQRSAFPGKYAGKVGVAQQLVKKAGLYDRGGWLQPGGIAVNHLKRPEPVLHPDHWSAVVDQTEAVDELVGAGVGGGGGLSVTVYGQTTGEIVQEMRREQWRGSHGYGSRGR
ncbi:MAG: phage tail tape measure protein [Gordonia sp. (in: high G+C Gram-positive bacteria)]|uniref:phage tail tape measure protein n=1 Tax=Gordonia sp. (in: high G+C Gram-positive bacteria) TaxID=84139 RepID=UPI003C73AD49